MSIYVEGSEQAMAHDSSHHTITPTFGIAYVKAAVPTCSEAHKLDHTLQRATEDPPVP